MITVTIGPVPTASARAWLLNANASLRSIEANSEKLPFRLPPESLREMSDLIADWWASCVDEQWESEHEFGTAQLQALVTYWFNITQLDDDQRGRLGITFSPPLGREFGDALARAVGSAMRQSPELQEFAARLAELWADCQPVFAASVVAAAH